MVASQKENTAGNRDTTSKLNLRVSPDKMHAVMSISLPLVRKLKYEDVIKLLSSVNIRYGLDKAKVLRNIEELNSAPSGFSSHEFQAAAGTSPTPSRDGRIEILIAETPRIHFDANGRADFRNIDRFKQIEKKTVLARRIPPASGQHGYNVYGDEIPPRKPADPRLKCGANVYFSEATNEYLAEQTGIFIKDGDEISINPVLYIPGNAGIESGNLVYDGNIHIGGNVEHGALVSSQSHLRVDGFIESNLIRAGRSLYIAKGINASGNEIPYVGKDLNCTYMDNTRIIVMGNTIVERSIHASHCILHGNLEMAPGHSIIVGGELNVFGSIITDQIGNYNEIITKLNLGYHNANDRYHQIHSQELKQAKEEYAKLQEEILRYKQYVTRSRNISSEMQGKIRSTYEKYKKQAKLVYRLDRQVKAYYEGRYNSETIYLTARKAIFAGVEISYRNYKKAITNTLQEVTIRFSPGEEKPQFTTYTPPT